MHHDGGVGATAEGRSTLDSMPRSSTLPAASATDRMLLTMTAAQPATRASLGLWRTSTRGGAMEVWTAARTSEAIAFITFRSGSPSQSPPPQDLTSRL